MSALASARRGEPPERSDGKFKSAGDELQTDETFDRVFSPAIAAAVARGEKYESFRDSIRASWKPERRRPARRS